MPADFGWSEFWGLATLATWLYSHLPMRPLYARSHCLGGDVMLVQWFVCEVARRRYGDLSPIEFNAVIDAITAAVFLCIALRDRAAWAAACFLLHVAMIVLHFAFFMGGEANERGYIVMLNGLFGMSLLSVNTAIWAGRHAGLGERMDHFFSSRWPQWTFSGLGPARLARHRGKVE